MIERKISPHLLEMARYFPVVTILGPRQSGKTTLARKVFANHVYVNLEDKTAREIAMSDPKAFFELYTTSLFTFRNKLGAHYFKQHILAPPLLHRI